MPPAPTGREAENVRAVLMIGDDELIVATDAVGTVCVTGDRDALPRRAQAQLAYHDVATSRRVLDVRAQELYILDLQTIEMLPDAPGLNDPLYVYGLMYGPYPTKQDVVAVEGQLTVTRADLLGALVDGVDMAFAYPPDAHGSRAVHALLPGEAADMIALGRGIVLALPLAPPWLPDCPTSNDLVAAQLIHDVLVALRAELRVDTPLPVPSRAALEADLIAKGWRIEGDTALRPKSTGVLGALRGAEKKVLPRQATLDELVAEARAVLEKMPGVPTPEANALRARRAPAPMVIKTPIPTTVAPVPPSAQPRPRVVTNTSEWVKDFVDAHRSPERPAPVVSTPARAISKAATPAWMEDFAPPEDEPQSAEKVPAAKPDWSSDFE